MDQYFNGMSCQGLFHVPHMSKLYGFGLPMPQTPIGSLW